MVVFFQTYNVLWLVYIAYILRLLKLAKWWRHRVHRARAGRRRAVGGVSTLSVCVGDSGVDCGRFHKTMLNNFISPLRRPSLRVAQLEGIGAPLHGNLHCNSDHVETLTATPPPPNSWIYNFVAFINSNFAWELAIAFRATVYCER